MKLKYRFHGIIVGLILSILVLGVPTFAEAVLNAVPNPFPILVDGAVDDTIEGVNIGGYTYLRLRDMGKMGVVIKFNETENKIEITTKKTEESELGTEINNPDSGSTILPPNDSGTSTPQEPSSTDTTPVDISQIFPVNSDDTTGIPNPDHP